jgi:hypothetical protein
VWWEEDLRCVFLTVSAHGRFRVSGVNPLYQSVTLDIWMGTDQGIHPWVVTLVKAGDGKFDGKTFLGRTWVFFSWGKKHPPKWSSMFRGRPWVSCSSTLLT